MSDALNILVPASEYHALLEKEFELKVIFNALFSTKDLNYNDTELRFDDTALSTIIKTLWPHEFEALVAKIQAEREEK